MGKYFNFNLFYYNRIVLGLVNFKDNIIDYPNSKDYLQKFLNMILEENVIDKQLLKVYQKCCDNLEKI
jgi:hypothetical protein